MIKILHQLNLDTIGGVENLFKNYCASSQALLFKQQLVVSNKKIHPELLRVIKTNVRNIDYAKYFFGIKLPSFLRRWHVRSVLKKLKPDLVIYWNNCHYSIEAVEDLKIPYVYYDHGLSWLHPDCPRYQKFLRDARGIIACGRSSQRMLQLRWGVEDEKIRVVPNGLRADLLPLSPRAKTLLTPRPLTLLVGGRLLPIKGQCLVLHALWLLLKENIPATLLIAGDGRDRERLEKLAQSLHLEKAVTFLGVVHDMAALYTQADFFVTPALRDPYPLIAIEALSFGCVPIAAAIDGYPDIITKETGFCVPPELPLASYIKLGGDLHGMPNFVYNPIDDCLIEPRIVDPSRIVASIKKCLQNPNLYHSLSKAGIEAGKVRFDFATYVAQFNEAISGNL